ncbi:MAG TPA: tol-pal system-associated acyl-CoA thioesterase [Chromatiaceae bacterium]|nr:tol-pal system-associated acyl-CoA thioesterase [Chromatiaceae bacterium]
MTTPAPPPLFNWRVRVYYEDTDAGGVVYHASYLRFMERARAEWLRSLGYEQRTLRAGEDLGFIVRAASLDFIKGARLDDLLEVSVALARRGGASLDFAQEVRNGANGILHCRGLIKVACVSGEHFRPSPLPKRLLAEIADVC